MKKWTIEDSKELYNINGWGTSYFGINEQGNVFVTPCKDGTQIDLREVMDELSLRDVTSPVLLRFPDILDNRIEKTWSCFKKAAKEYEYKAENYVVFPIKVNQMQPVVEEIISHGRKFNLGIEAGSKPELHAVIAVQCQSDSIIICNGYKDQSYIELALLAQKMGKRIFIVVEKLNELEIIAREAKKLGVRPNIGIRIKLASSWISWTKRICATACVSSTSISAARLRRYVASRLPCAKRHSSMCSCIRWAITSTLLIVAADWVLTMTEHAHHRVRVQ